MCLVRREESDGEWGKSCPKKGICGSVFSEYFGPTTPQRPLCLNRKKEAQQSHWSLRHRGKFRHSLDSTLFKVTVQCMLFKITESCLGLRQTEKPRRSCIK